MATRENKRKRNERILELHQKGETIKNIVNIIKREFGDSITDSRVHQIYTDMERQPKDGGKTLYLNLNEIKEEQIVIKLGKRTITIR